MSNLINTMYGLPNFVHMTGATQSDIAAAEKALGVSFAEDYRTYVSAFGVAAFEGHELTGVCKSRRLNVVDVTLDEHRQNDNIPVDWYVLEQTGIDGIVIWQNKMGAVFQTAPMQCHRRIAKDLIEYIGY